MVRHEAAEALGAIEFPEDDVTGASERDALLRTFASVETEPDQAVRESCVVALDTENYWSLFGTDNERSSRSDVDGNSNNASGPCLTFAQHKSGGGKVGVPSTSDLQAAHFNTLN
jgi:hypothetical protein